MDPPHKTMRFPFYLFLVSITLGAKAFAEPMASTAWESSIVASGTEALSNCIASGISCEERDANGLNALMRAAKSGRADLVRLLLKHGALIDARDPHGDTALSFAVWEQKPACAALLVDAGANPNLLGVSTPLHLAVLRKDKDLVEIVLRAKGLRPDIRNRWGWTPLFTALVADFQPEIAELLLKAGANPNLRFQTPHDTILHSLCLVPDVSLAPIAFVLDRGADGLATAKNGDTAYSRAYQAARPDLMDYLRSRKLDTGPKLLLPPHAGSAELSPSLRWVIALGAPLALRNRMELGLPGGVLPDKNGQQTAQSYLKSSWGITDAETAHTTLLWLVEKGHRSKYAPLAAGVAAYDDVAYGKFRRQMTESKGFPGEVLDALRQSGQTRPDSAGTGWDACRASMVAGWCIQAGYIPESKAWPLIKPLVVHAQQTYKSWRELGEDYLLGRRLWSAGDNAKSTGELNAQTEFVIRKMLGNQDDPNNPWAKLPWHTPLDTL